MELHRSVARSARDRWWPRVGSAVTALAICAFGLLTGLDDARAQANAASASRLQVVATFSILADISARIGGGRTQVTTLVARGGDVHTYRPRPQDAAKIKAADVLVANGAGFETWLDRLADAADFTGRKVIATRGAQLLTLGSGIKDPHAWHDPRNGMVYAARVADGFCAADPEHCPLYRGNADALAAELAAIDTALETAFAALPPDQRSVVTSHAAFRYFGSRYGLHILSAQGLTTDVAPSARDMARLVREIRRRDARVYVIEAGHNGRVLNQVARETRLSGSALLYAETLSPTDGPAGSYPAMLRHNGRMLLRALRKAKATK